MAIDLSTEQVLGLTEATKLLPRFHGKRPAVSTLWRWCRKGVGGVHLEYVRVGRRIATSHEALGRFFAAVAQADKPLACPDDRQPFQITRSPSEISRQRAIERAERRLAEAGI